MDHLAEPGKPGIRPAGPGISAAPNRVLRRYPGIIREIA